MHHMKRTGRLSIVLAVVMAYILRPPTVTADIDLPFIELIFENHYKGHGEIEWTDFTETFCRFMRPSEWLFAGTRLTSENVTLATRQWNTIIARILTCVYAQREALNTSTNEDHYIDVWYAQGPDHKHYEMRKPGIGPDFENFVIYDQVSVPLEEVEKLFFDDFVRSGGEGKLKWRPGEIADFCLFVCPNDYAIFSIYVKTRDIILASYDYIKLDDHLLACEYRPKDREMTYVSGTSTDPLAAEFAAKMHFPFQVWYAKAPDGKCYELREYGNERDHGLAIYQEIKMPEHPLPALLTAV